MKCWLIGIAFLVAIGIGVGFIVHDYEMDREERGLERYTYEGRITAMEYNQPYHRTHIWLNSTPKAVEIQGRIELMMGEEYLIIVDGNGKLINAKIIEEEIRR